MIFRLCFFLLLAFPIIELWLLIEVSGMIGGLGCVVLVIFTALVGGFLARRQGFDTIRRLRERAEKGEPIAVEMFDTVVLLFAGLLLVFPGLLSDVVGFMLLVPGIRKYLHSVLAESMQQGRKTSWFRYSQGNRAGEQEVHTEKVIDIDVTKQ